MIPVGACGSLTFVGVVGYPVAQAVAAVALGIIGASMWVGQLRSLRTINRQAADIERLADLLKLGTKTIDRGTALAEFAGTQSEAARLIERFAQESNATASAALKALAHHDPDRATELATVQIAAFARLEEHLPDMERATREWLAVEERLG